MESVGNVTVYFEQGMQTGNSHLGLKRGFIFNKKPRTLNGEKLAQHEEKDPDGFFTKGGRRGHFVARTKTWSRISKELSHWVQICHKSDKTVKTLVTRSLNSQLISDWHECRQLQLRESGSTPPPGVRAAQEQGKHHQRPPKQAPRTLTGSPEQVYKAQRMRVLSKS